MSLAVGATYDAFMVYKGNALFSAPWLTETTPFGAWWVRLSNGYGWTVYNHREITLYWKNVASSGFYRQSTSNVGASQGYTMINVTGIEGREFNAQPPLNTLTEMPGPARDFVAELRALP